MENQETYRIRARQLLECASVTTDIALARRLIHQAADWHEMALIAESYRAVHPDAILTRRERL